MASKLQIMRSKKNVSPNENINSCTELDKIKEKGNKYKTFKSCVSVKFVILLLFATGISKEKKYNFIQCCMFVMFHVAWLISTIKAILCTQSTNDRQDLYSGIIVSDVLAIILWWNLYIRRLKIFELVLILRKTSARVTLTGVVVFFAVGFFLLFPFFFNFIFKIVHQNFFNETKRKHSCRNYWLRPDYPYLAGIVFTLDMMNMYINYGPYFMVALMYCFYSFMILQNFKNENILSQTPVRYMNLVIFQKQFEKEMSFPIFIVLGKIASEVFTTVSLMSSKTRSESMLSFQVSSLQMLVWFLLIVVIADMVNGGSSKIIENAILMRSKLRDAPVDYFSYKKMKKRCTLTAWNITVIDRKLFLTSLALLISYSVVISDVNDKYSSVNGTISDRISP